MKTLNTIVFFAIAIGALSASISRNSVAEKKSIGYVENNQATSGMFFSSKYVVEEYEYDDAYCITYNDADANLFNVEICVDLETYQIIRSAIDEKRELVGVLVLNDDLSDDNFKVFTYIPEI